MRVSIIIPTYNHLDDALKPCLESVLKYTSFDDKELIVVANGCTDGTRQYLDSLNGHVRTLWFDRALGFPEAINEGIRQAKGEYLILLNNDTVLLEQSKDAWINSLIKPLGDKAVGLSGPMIGYSEPADANFIIFFCIAIRKDVIEKVGYLDDSFAPGGGEDTDYCLRAIKAGFGLAQVPDGSALSYDDSKGVCIGAFPIWHKGEATVGQLKGWDDIFRRNSQILRERYNRRWKLSNNCERAVIGKTDEAPPREEARYKWAAEKLAGPDVLEIGCSSGYGLRFMPDDINYLGIDKDAGVIDYARSQFGNRFRAADINDFELKFYDTIIAFEVIEHLDRGLEFAQKLKMHCRKLLLTVPYKEPPGFWGPHHRLHELTEDDFPGFHYVWMDEQGRITDKPTDNPINLMLMEWDFNTATGDMVTAMIPTKDRYFTTLPLAVSAVANQIVKPSRLLIFDDGEQRDLREVSPYDGLFRILNAAGIKWKMFYGKRKGQSHSHQAALEMCETPFIWRLDDDNLPQPDALQQLLFCLGDGIGAVGGIVINPRMSQMPMPVMASNKIGDIFLGLNKQWYVHEGAPESVDHLYSSFLYRKEASRHGYELGLSPLCFREETMFTYEMKRAGWRLVINPAALTWHLQASSGGVRQSTREMRDHDESIFLSRLNEWGVKPSQYKFIILDNGLGDHYAFRQVLPDIREKHGDKKLVIAACYPEAFEGETDIALISIAEAKLILGDITPYNIYRHGGLQQSRQKKSHICDLYKELYL